MWLRVAIWFNNEKVEYKMQVFRILYRLFREFVLPAKHVLDNLDNILAEDEILDCVKDNIDKFLKLFSHRSVSLSRCVNTIEDIWLIKNLKDIMADSEEKLINKTLTDVLQRVSIE